MKLTIALALLLSSEAERPEVHCGPQAALVGVGPVATYPWWEYVLRADPDRPFRPRLVWPAGARATSGGVWGTTIVAALGGVPAAEAWYRALWGVK